MSHCWRAQVTAIFLVDAEKCLPSPAAWPKVWEEHEAWRKLRNAREAEDARKAAQAEKVRQQLLALWWFCTRVCLLWCAGSAFLDFPR